MMRTAWLVSGLILYSVCCRYEKNGHCKCYVYVCRLPQPGGATHLGLPLTWIVETICVSKVNKTHLKLSNALNTSADLFDNYESEEVALREKILEHMHKFSNLKKIS